MANDNCLEGIQCFNADCKSEGPFDIDAKILVRVYDSGTEDQGGDYEWGEDHFCQCVECGVAGTVKDFRIENHPKPYVDPEIVALHEQVELVHARHNEGLIDTAERNETLIRLRKQIIAKGAEKSDDLPKNN